MSDRPNASATQPAAPTPGPDAVPPPRRGHGVRWIVGLLAVAAVAALVFYNDRFAGEEMPNAAAAPAKPPVVTVSHPLQKTITEWDEFTGQFQAVDTVDVRARVSGYL